MAGLYAGLDVSLELTSVCVVDEEGRMVREASGTLLGYPVHVDNNMADIGTDAFPIAFGNFQQGYCIVDRQGIRIVRDEVSVKGTILLDTYKRVGGGLGDSNAIKWLKVATA